MPLLPSGPVLERTGRRYPFLRERLTCNTNRGSIP